MLNEVQEFLDNYHSGNVSNDVAIMLYSKVCPNNLAFLNRFKANPSIANMRVLILGFKNYVSENTKENTISVQKNINVGIENWTKKIHKNELDVNHQTAQFKSDYEELLKQLSYLYNHKAKLSNRLADEKTDEARSLLVTEILKSRDAYNTLAVRRNFYQEFGYFPDEITDDIEKQEKERTLAQLRMDLKNVHSNLSKKRKKINLCTDEGNRKVYESEQAELESVVLDLNLKIKLLLENG